MTESYVDALLSEQCDYSIEKGIESFEIDPFLTLLDFATKKIDGQFKTYKRSVEALQTQCVEEEEKHLASVQHARTKFNKALTEFKETEETISALSGVVMQAGERLQDLTTEATRGKQAALMLEMFTIFNTQKNFEPSKYKEEFPDVEYVTRIKKLQSLCSELDSEKNSLGIENINKFSEWLNDCYMTEFRKALMEKEIERIKEYAELLYHLNGGEDSVEEYLDNLTIFNDENDVKNDELLASTEQEIPTNVCKINNQCLQVFYKRMMGQVQKENREIERIFIQKGHVTNMFVSRIFDERIENYLDIYLHESNFKLGEYLFAFYDAYDQTVNGYLSGLVEKVFEDDRNFYAENEKDYVLSVFQNMKSIYDARKKQIKIDSSHKVDISSIPTLINPTEFQSVMDQLVFATIRAETLAHHDVFSKLIPTIFQLFMNFYNGVLVDCAEKLEYLTSKQQPNTQKSLAFLQSFLQILSNICTVIGNIQNVYNKHMSPTFKFSLQELQNASSQFNKVTDRLEDTLSHAVYNLRDWLLNCVTKLLSYKNEFKFKDEQDDTWLKNPKSTQTCNILCSFLNDHVKAINDGLTGLNRKHFIIEFAHGFHEELVKSFKKLKITPISGGFIFMYDINKISETIHQLHFPSITKPMFEDFSMLHKLFCVDKNSVAVIARAIGGESGLKFIDLNDFVKCRTDYTKDMKII
ncbi:Exocyst complex component sec10 [Entamoeba marina]